MKITCWNCQTTYTLKNAAVDTALAAMDQAKVGFYDVHCPKCGKVNRTVRADFQKTEKPKVRSGDARKARPKVKEARPKKKAYKGR